MENAKARLTLGIESKWTLAQAIELTMGWYRALNDGADARLLCEQDIDAYEALP